jgi:ABC-type transport system involved in Fe-S cluster assembly fused permease/ATPase subunit
VDALCCAVLCCGLQWRTGFRKEMNRSEAQANNRAIDSLINYETVKYCGNEEHEVKRYDECMHKYQVTPRKMHGGLTCSVYLKSGFFLPFQY